MLRIRAQLLTSIPSLHYFPEHGLDCITTFVWHRWASWLYSTCLPAVDHTELD